MDECDVKARLCVWWRDLTGYLPISEPRCSRRIQEEASMCVKSRGSRRIDFDLCC